jgi:uncharacterized protein (TIGR02271 family)
MASDESDPNAGAPARPTGPIPAAAEPDTVKVFEEELSVGTETVETGRVRVRIATHEHEETVDVPLRGQRVEVERVAIGREVEAVPPRRQEGDTTIVPVVEEVVVVSRKLVLKEEIRLKAVSSTEQYRESVVLHSQEAVVERAPAREASPNQKPT